MTDCAYCHNPITGEEFRLTDDLDYLDGAPVYCSEQCQKDGIDAIRLSLDEMANDAAYEQEIGEVYGFP